VNSEVDRRDVDELFGAIAQRRRVGRMHDRLRDPQFWRDLNPQLTISETAIGPSVQPLPVSAEQADHHAAFLMEEGYLQTPPLFPIADITLLREAVERIVALGLPSGLAWVYDEFYGLMARLAPVVRPMLGPDPLMLPRDFWVFHISPGSHKRTGFGAYGRHRDYFVDRSFIDGGLPCVLNTWIPLTDVTTLDSCMYVVHPEGDDDYRAEVQEVRSEAVRLEDIRALPTPAGAVIAFSSRVAHWGSRSSRFATGPRIAVTCVLQRRDCEPFEKEVVDLTQPLTWERRIDLVFATLGSTGLEAPRDPPHVRGERA
jgi:hypothetical protein